MQVLETRPEAGTPLVSAEDPTYGRLYRLWVGDYRVIYAVQRSAGCVVLVPVGHRKTVYRGMTE